MKLGRKEATRWKQLAENLGEFQERFCPLELLSPEQLLATEVPVEVEEKDSETSSEPEAEREAESGPPNEPEPNEELEFHLSQALAVEEPPALESLLGIVASEFFRSLSWDQSSPAESKKIPQRQAQPLAANGSARSFFSQVCWNNRTGAALPTFEDSDRSLSKLMQIATRQAVQTSRQASSTAALDNRSPARAFFSSVPWKKPA